MNSTIYMILFGLIFTTVISLVQFYIWKRLVKQSKLPKLSHKVLTGVSISFAIITPVLLIVSRGFPTSISSILLTIPYLWMGMVLQFFSILLTIDLVKLIVKVVKKISKSSDNSKVDESRRVNLERIIAGATVLVVVGITVGGVINAAQKPTVINQKIKIENLPNSLENMKIVQISDLHIGEMANKKWLGEVVDSVNSLNPDVVVITGDLVDGIVSIVGDEIEPLKRLKSTFGTYFVTGNHEYYSGADEWIELIETLNVKVLRNEGVHLGHDGETILLAGVDDHRAKRMVKGHGTDVPKSLKNRKPNEPSILLSHQPVEVIEAASHNVDLVLAGHTHGGQIYPLTYLIWLNQPYNKGLYQHSKSTQIYVNQGTGLWGPPMRVGTQKEITKIILTSK